MPWAESMELCDIHKSNQIESNSQLSKALTISSEGCVISTKVIKLKAIHNTSTAKIEGFKAV